MRMTLERQQLAGLRCFGSHHACSGFRSSQTTSVDDTHLVALAVTSSTGWRIHESIKETHTQSSPQSKLMHTPG